MALSIQPTLFIGIGSSGRDILAQLRMMILEEFGVPGLPVYRFINLYGHNEQEDEDKGKIEYQNEFFKEDWQRINIVRIPMNDDDLSSMAEMMNKNNKELYNKDLAKWLHPTLLSQTHQDFTGGAGNTRMAGRAMLWFHWEEVSNELTDASDSINGDTAIADSYTALTPYMVKYNLEQNFISRRRNAYLLGSLCGGTCSGTFLDLAYLLRDEMEYQVNGVFSINGRDIADKEGTVRLAANAWAALKELDYYSHPITTYEEKPISRNTTIKSKEPPFNHVRLASPLVRGVAISSDKGRANLEPLHQIISSTLFFEIFGTSMQRILVDLRNTPSGRYRDMKESSMLKFLSFFGASMFWYPKERISKALASRYLHTLFCRWLGKYDQFTIDEKKDTLPPKVIDMTKVNKHAEEIIDKCMKDLNSFFKNKYSNQSFSKLKRESISNLKLKLGKQATALSMSNKIAIFDGGMEDEGSNDKNEPLIDRFCVNGEYLKNIIDNVELAAQRLREAIDSEIATITQKAYDLTLNTSDDCETNLQYVYMVVDQVQNLLTKKYNDLPDEAADNPVILNATIRKRMELVLKDRWSKLLGLSKEAKLNVIEDIAKSYSKALTASFNQAVSYAIRQTIDLKLNKEHNIRDYLTQVVIPKHTALQSIVESLAAELLTSYKNSLADTSAPHRLVVVSNGKDNLEEEVTKLYLNLVSNKGKMLENMLNIKVKDSDKILKDYIIQKVKPLDDGEIDSANVLAFIFVDMVSHELVSSNAIMQNFNLIETALKHAPGKVDRIAKASEPLFEKSPSFQAASFKPAPKLLGGGEPSSLGKLTKAFKTFPRKEDISLKHMVMFYQEECSVAIDDIGYADAMEIALSKSDKEMKNSNKMWGHFTSKNPPDIAREYLRSDLEEKVFLNHKLYFDLMFEPYVSEYANEKLLTEKQYVFKYTLSENYSDYFVVNAEEPEKFYNQLIRQDQLIKLFSQRFTELEKSLTKEDLETRIQSQIQRLRMQQVNEDIIDDEREELFKYLKRLFPDEEKSEK